MQIIFIYIISVISIFDIFERSYAPFSVTTTGLDKKPGFNSTTRPCSPFDSVTSLFIYASAVHFINLCKVPGSYASFQVPSVQVRGTGISFSIRPVRSHCIIYISNSNY